MKMTIKLLNNRVKIMKVTLVVAALLGDIQAVDVDRHYSSLA